MDGVSTGSSDYWKCSLVSTGTCSAVLAPITRCPSRVPLSTVALGIVAFPKQGLVTIFGCGLSGSRIAGLMSKCFKRLAKPDNKIIRFSAPRTASP